MAALVAPTSIHSSSHDFPPHGSELIAFHQHVHRTPAGSHHNPFEAFAPHHHSGSHSRSAVASWRHSEPVMRAPINIPGRTPSPKYRRPGFHSRTTSTSNGSWRSQIHSPTPKPDASSELYPKVSSPLVYSIAELLRLSASPLVGINKESQTVVDDLVTHHVWRRGPQSRPPRVGDRCKSRDISKPRSLHTSSDDSEHSD